MSTVALQQLRSNPIDFGLAYLHHLLKNFIGELLFKIDPVTNFMSKDAVEQYILRSNLRKSYDEEIIREALVNARESGLRENSPNIG